MAERHTPAFPQMIYANHPHHHQHMANYGHMGPSGPSGSGHSSSHALNQVAYSSVASAMGSASSYGGGLGAGGSGGNDQLGTPPVLGQNVTIDERGKDFMRVTIEGRKDKPFVCIHQRSCFKVFKRRSDLTVHMRYHSGEKPFACPHPNCGAAFAQSSTLKVHERKHTGDKPFICPYPSCKQRTTTKSDLRKHIRVHTGEKPFGCTFPQCGMRFTERGSLRVHWKRHQQNPAGALNGDSLGLNLDPSRAARKKKTKGKKRRQNAVTDNGWVTAIRQAVGVDHMQMK